MWSKLMDRGRDEMVVWPAVPVEGQRGSVEYEADLENPIRLRVSTSEDRSMIADLHGQVDVNVVRAVTRSFPNRPGMTWSRCWLNGIEYDMAEPPRWSRGPSLATSHWEFKLRSRANLGATDLESPDGIPLIDRSTR